MPIKPIAAGTPQRIIDKINEIVGAVNTGGASILRCNLTYTGDGSESAPYVGHLDHASEILNALDPESSYDPIIAINYALPGDQTKQMTPAGVIRSVGEYEGTPYSQNELSAYAPVRTANVTLAFTIGTTVMGGTAHKHIDDHITGITTNEWTVSDDVISFTDSQD